MTPETPRAGVAAPATRIPHMTTYPGVTVPGGGDITPAAPYTSGVEVIGPGRYVQVPDDLPPELADLDLAVWVLLVWRAGRNPVAWPTQETLMADVGRGGGQPRELRRALRRLEAAGVLATVRTHWRGRTLNTYRPLARVAAGDGRRYTTLPGGLLVAVAAGHATAAHVAAAVRWGRLCGRPGTTDIGVAQAAQPGLAVANLDCFFEG